MKLKTENSRKINEIKSWPFEKAFSEIDKPVKNKKRDDTNHSFISYFIGYQVCAKRGLRDWKENDEPTVPSGDM